MTPFDTLWAGDLLDQVGFGAGDRVLDLAAAGGRGGGLTLPFGDASFDVVVCHHGLQLLPDRGRALAEVRRVLAPRGWAAVAVWGPIGRNPAFAALAESLERRAGVRRGHRPPAERDRCKVLADLETALGPWVDTAGLRVVTEANIAVAAR